MTSGRQPVAEGAGTVAPATVDRRPALYTLPFIGICLVALFGFSQNFVLQPMLPLVVLALGGDATMVGIVFLVFSIPSVVLRPYIGRLADRFGTRRVLLVGTAGTALAGPLYLVPSIAFILFLRIAHGTVWAAFNTGGPSTMANLAPPGRRGEASAAFDLMPGLAVLIMPTVALLLHESLGLSAALVLASVFGVATLAAVVWLIPPDAEPAGRTSTASSGGALLEPSAVLPMIFQLLLSMAIPLFVVYPPLFAASLGLPLSDLVVYYPVYGIVFVLSRVVAGRVVDRVPRGWVLIGGAALSGVALLVAVTGSSILTLTVAGVLYAIANGATAPATTSLTIDRAPPGRLGAAMATYTLGFQFGSGLGAALWGFLIAASGFQLSFVVAAALQFLLLAIVVRGRASTVPAAVAG